MRKLFVFLFAVLLSSVVFAQVESGNFGASGNDKGYTLNKNEGNRSFSIEVSFKKNFEVKPEIVLSVRSLDVAQETAVRYSIEATAVSRDGFVISIKTWGDTKINGIGGSWLAVAEK